MRPNGMKITGAVVLCLGTLATATMAADEPAGFRLWVEPIDLWVLEQDVDTNSSKFEEYRDLGTGLWAGLNLFGESADGNRNFAIRLAGIGREDSRSTVDYRVEGRYSLSVDYNQIPHRFGNDGTLLWTRTGVNRFELPDSTQDFILGSILAFREAGGFVNDSFLGSLLEPFIATAGSVDLGLQRDRTSARVDLGKLGKMAWAFEVRHENRDGTRPLGASFGFFNVQEIPEPIDYDTTDAEITGEFRGQRGGARFGYRHSTFENGVDTVVWDNPFRSFDSTDPIAYLGPNLTPNGPATGRVDLAPDNEADLLYADGRVRGERWWAQGSAASSTMTQDDPIVPFTSNTAIVGVDAATGATFDAATEGLPIQRADTEVETLKLSGTAGFDLAEAWTLTARYRYYDYDNSSPRVRFPGYVRMDSVWESPALITVPYDYTRDTVGLELAWALAPRTDLRLSWSLESWDRSFREIEESEEDTVELSLTSRPNDKISLRASWATGDRSTSAYDVEAQEVFFEDPPGINNQPALRKFDEAVRDVDDYDLTIQLFPDDSWNVSLGLSGREEDYPDSVFGLSYDDLASFHFELGYSPGSDWNAYLFGHAAERDVFQRARQSGGTLSENPADDWSALLNEDTVTWGLGLQASCEPGWTLDLTAQISDTDGEADFETPGGGAPDPAVDFDNYEDIELVAITVKLSYQVNDSVAVGAGYLYEDYTIDSFIVSGLVPYLPASILLAPNDGDYEAHVVGVNLRVMF